MNKILRDNYIRSALGLTWLEIGSKYCCVSVEDLDPQTQQYFDPLSIFNTT